MANLRPNKRVFLHYSLAISYATFLVVFLIITIVLAFINPLLIPVLAIVFLGVLALITASRVAQYKKARYTIAGGRIIISGGGLVSNHEAELVAKNTTQVWMTLPWLEHKLFGTGTILVRAAGSSGDEIVFRHVDDPQKLYAQIQSMLQKNGFRLTKKDLLQREEPSILGVTFEVLQGVVFSLFILFFVAGSFIAALITEYFLLAITGFLLLLSVFGGVQILRFLDLKHKEYHLYQDTITYRDGFLTQHFSTIPAENLADAKITQNFIDRIFGLYTVIISSQGSENNITFSNMKHGDVFKKKLEGVIDAYEPLIKSTKGTTTKKTTKSTRKTAAKTVAQPLRSYKMSLQRTILPPIITMALLAVLVVLIAAITSVITSNFFLFAAALLIILILLVLAGVSVVIALVVRAATTYYLTKNGVREEFSFIRKHNVEFSLDKVTMIAFNKNPLDWFFNTCTIHIRSIGSSEQITFKHVEDSLIQTIRSIHDVSTKEKNIIKPEFGLKQFLLKNLYGLITLAVLISITSIILLFTPVALLSPMIVGLVLFALSLTLLHRFFYYRRAALYIGSNYLCYERGLIFQEQNYVRFTNIKDITTKQYINATTGSLTISAAGELVQQSNNQQVKITNGFSAHYLQEIFNIHDTVDTLLGMNKQKTVLSSNRALANTMLPSSLFSIIFWPLIPFLPLVAINTKKYTYIIEEERIRKQKGIFFRQQKTILFDRIDHLNSREGPINKLYKNGTVLVYTAGSSSAEMVLADIPQYKNFYKVLEEQYKE